MWAQAEHAQSASCHLCFSSKEGSWKGTTFAVFQGGFPAPSYFKAQAGSLGKTGGIFHLTREPNPWGSASAAEPKAGAPAGLILFLCPKKSHEGGQGLRQENEKIR